MSLDAFRSGAAFYDALFDPVSRAERETPFLRSVLDRAPGKRVVDLACGTGFHARLFAEQGARVDAFDLSQGMIDRARVARAHPNIRYATGDMRSLAGGPWDMAICLGNSLALLPDQVALEETFNAVAKVLSPKGIFLTQVLNYAKRAKGEPSHLVTTKQVGPVEVTAVKNLVPRESVTYLSLSYFARSGGEVSSIGETAVLQHWDAPLFRGVAEAHGFSVESMLGGFAEATYQAEVSADLVMVLRRP